MTDPVTGPGTDTGLEPLLSAAGVTAYLRRIWQEHAVGLVYDGHLHHVRVGTPYGERYGRDEVVADTVTFDLAAVPPGEYRLATGFYRPVEGLPRLEAVAPDGPLPDGRALLPESILVQ